VAAGEKLTLAQEDVKLDGWALESRLYAEDPYRNFLPSIGRLSRYRPPEEAPRKVRNDTGVFEGGEISMYYDPMIAKLCTWGPDRATALEEMRTALDAFEVEGIGHNLPFLSVVMDHPRFVSGEITTGFIAEEFPEGFDGARPDADTLRQVARAAAGMMALREARARKVSGRLTVADGNTQDDVVVVIGADSFPVAATDAVSLDWTPGRTLARGSIDGKLVVMKVEQRTAGFRIRWRGADLDVQVYTPRQAELAALMPEKLPADTSKLLLCPMPGLVVSIAVKEGQEVQEGQTLCAVEAMKMENVLRAERKAVVSKIHASAGQSLAVDDVIMEFE
ncbi:MAG TPA: DUF2118 domain-containing protein, partial [Pseudomonadales bacterium]|nr:DUF2118 domain-containing protein [Pseudomonadales bacterium]